MKKTTVKMKKVQSSNIDSIGYESGNLFIRFKGNAIYRYDKVLPETHDNLIKSDSIGKYVHKYIKGTFQCTKINPVDNKEFEFVDIKS